MQHRMLHLCCHYCSLIISNFAIGSDFPKANEGHLNNLNCTLYNLQWTIIGHIHQSQMAQS